MRHSTRAQRQRYEQQQQLIAQQGEHKPGDPPTRRVNVSFDATGKAQPDPSLPLPPVPDVLTDQRGTVYDTKPHIPHEEYARMRLQGIGAIGSGLEGSVYVASEGGSGRLVAIKRMPRHLASRARDQFDRARAAASLPRFKKYCIPPRALFEDDHAVYLVSDLVIGMDCWKYAQDLVGSGLEIQEKALRLETMLNAMIDAATALAKDSHIHRDNHMGNFIYDEVREHASLTDLDQFQYATNPDAFITDRIRLAFSLEAVRDLALANGVVIPGIQRVIDYHIHGLGIGTPRVNETYPQHNPIVYQQELQTMRRLRQDALAPDRLFAPERPG